MGADAHGHVLYESGAQLRNVHFPTTAIVSLRYVMEDGASAEIAGVGNEGLIGVALFMGGETMSKGAVVQSAGQAYLLRGHLPKQAFGRCGELQHLLLRYRQALLTQTAQTAVCNRHHTLDRPGLEARACECCMVLRKEFDRLLPYQIEPQSGLKPT